MKTVTLSAIRTQVRQQADKVNSAFVTDAELNSLINLYYARLYDLLTSKFQENYYGSVYSFSTVSGTQSYALPSDFYKLKGVDYVISPTQKYTLKRYMENERNRYRYNGYVNIYGEPTMRYSLDGDFISIMPFDDGSKTFEVRYIPVYTTLVNDNDTLDGINGYEQMIILDCAIATLRKEETDVSFYINERDKIMAQINEAAENRDAGQPQRVVDVYGGWYNRWDDID